MTGMEHAIEHAARTLFLSDRSDTLPAGFPERQWDEGHAVKDDYLRRARALAEAGLLAPAPLTEIRAENQFGETHRRWATDWELVNRAEGDGRADRPSWVDEHGINHADGDGGRW